MWSRKSTTFLILFFLCSTVAAADGGQTATEQNIFSGTFADAFWTVVSFILLVVVLGRVAWKPVLKKLNARQKYIQEQIETAENARKSAEKLLEEHKQQALQIITEATKQAQKETQELTEKTRQEVLEIRRRAQKDIKYARIAASEQLWKEAGDMVEALGCEVLGRVVTLKDNRRLIDDAIGKLRQKQNE
jgi:F-type H+-transporting ATPase subunit b